MSAIALMVSLVPFPVTAIGAEYRADNLVGVDPSVV